jgi:hypothetical protein
LEIRGHHSISGSPDFNNFAILYDYFGFSH